VTDSEEGLGGLRGEAEGRYAGEEALWLAEGPGDGGITGGHGKHAVRHEGARKASSFIGTVYMSDRSARTCGSSTCLVVTMGSTVLYDLRMPAATSATASLRDTDTSQVAILKATDLRPVSYSPYMNPTFKIHP
jgi:hypothetical protein